MIHTALGRVEAKALHLCQWHISRHARTAVHLYSAVCDLADHPRRSHLDHGNLNVAQRRINVTDGVGLTDS